MPRYKKFKRYILKRTSDGKEVIIEHTELSREVILFLFYYGIEVYEQIYHRKGNGWSESIASLLLIDEEYGK